jgi:hypothetical protein
MPIGSRSLDYYIPNTWPSPWEILFRGTFCHSSISLLIYYTLVMIDQDFDVELLLIDDGDDRYLLPLIDKKYILNYELGSVSTLSELEKCFTVVDKYDSTKIKQMK